MRARMIVPCLACFLVGYWWSSISGTSLTAEQAPIVQGPIPFPMEARLGSNLYLQTSAEYRACCLQIYRLAELRLTQIMQAGPARVVKPAVVMDLDETVFDNSAFQTFLYNNKLEYTQDLWDEYEKTAWKDVTLIPGARRFINQAEVQGVTVIYVSNRTKPLAESTIGALKNNNINIVDIEHRLFLKADGKASSDKSARRDEINAGYNVLLYFGDNLRDFSEVFVALKMAKDATLDDYRKAITQRSELVDAAACHWGIDWFVLPNPVYGEWDKLAGPDPIKLLHPTSMKINK